MTVQWKFFLLEHYDQSLHQPYLPLQLDQNNYSFYFLHQMQLLMIRLHL